MNQNWKNDPRVRTMDTNKLEYLTKMAEQIGKTPKNQLMTAFMSMTLEANNHGVQFSDQETDLLVSILTADMSPAEKKKLDTLRMLSRKLAKNGK